MGVPQRRVERRILETVPPGSGWRDGKIRDPEPSLRTTDVAGVARAGATSPSRKDWGRESAYSRQHWKSEHGRLEHGLLVDPTKVRRHCDVVELRARQRFAYRDRNSNRTRAQLSRKILVQPLAVFDEVSVAVLIAVPAINVALFCAKACAQSA
jgi:hypothetical protein